jgi:hypothetical protein
MTHPQRPPVLLYADLTSLCQVNVASPTSARPFQPRMAPDYAVMSTEPDVAPRIWTAGFVVLCKLLSLGTVKLSPVLREN